MNDLIVADILDIARTVKMEAEGEPWEGKLAVAWVIINRTRGGASIQDVVFKSKQFSCWNEDSPTRMRLDEGSHELWRQCIAAATAAYFMFVTDPTFGAVNYLNIEVTKKMNGGRLPSWVAKMKHTVKIGQHDFYRESR